MRAPETSGFPQEELFPNTTNNRVLTRQNNTTLDNPPPARKTNHDPKTKEITGIFNHWVNTCRNNNKGRRPVLDDKRRRKIKQALKHYDAETLKQAITGNTKSDFHQGNNPQGKTYDELTLILRDAEHIEQFLTYNDQDDIEAWKNE